MHRTDSDVTSSAAVVAICCFGSAALLVGWILVKVAVTYGPHIIESVVGAFD